MPCETAFARCRAAKSLQFHCSALWQANLVSFDQSLWVQAVHTSSETASTENALKHRRIGGYCRSRFLACKGIFVLETNFFVLA